MTAVCQLARVSPTRRALLDRTAVALSGGALASLADCLDDPVPGGGAPATDDSPTPDDETATAEPDGTAPGSEVAFERWLPTPETTPIRDGYGVQAFDVATLRERRDALHENASERLQSEWRWAGPDERFVPSDDVTATVEVGFDAAVALGSFDPSAFRERYRSAQQPEGTASPTDSTPPPTSDPERYAGFDLYGTDRLFAVSEDAILEVGHRREDDSRAYAEAILDARTEETANYPAGNAYVEALLGVVDGPHVLKCYPEAMDGSTSRGFRKEAITGGIRAWRFGPETTHLTFGYTYADDETAADSDLASYLEAESDRFGVYDGLDVRTDGRLVWADGDAPTAEFDHLSPGGPDEGVHTENG